MYSKRAGTSGIRGQLYETKLLSLLYFRAIHDNDIEEFQLASNIDNIGAFDDICFKAKVKGFDKPVAVFIQAKHRENEKQTLHNDLAIYFDSYMKIRQRFDPSINDVFFRGTFDETECLFVIYTTAKDDFDNNSSESGFFSNLYDLIDTGHDIGGTAKQPYNQEEDVEFLCKIIIKDQITSLPERIVRFVYDERNFQMMLCDDLVLRYHVTLAQKVFNVSEIQAVQSKDAPQYRIASFRQDFFDNNEEYITIFKDTLYLEIIKRRKIKPADIRLFLSEFLGDPTDAGRLSKLIGTVITYNNGQLEFDKKLTKDFRPGMKPMDVSRTTVNKAVELAAREILTLQKFKVPAAFGNKDLTISGSDVKIERRINHLASRINGLLANCKSSKMVTIDESLEDGFLQLNGGIAGAIGNILVLDDDNKQMKITDNWELLEKLAQKLYKKLSKEYNLLEYKFCVNINKFPKLSFDSNEYEKNLARDFLKKLLFFSGQADENGVEASLKNDIEDYQRDHPNYFQVKTDAIFLKYHDEIQDWWMKPKEASYLTRKSDLFQNAINNIIKDPLMNSINDTFMRKMKSYNYTFTEDAVRSLNLQDQHSSTVIVAENSVLTIVKLMQHLKNRDHVVLDLEYVGTLPTNDRNKLRTELKNTNETKYLIFVCDKILNTRSGKKVLENIAEAVHNEKNNKKTIIITNNMLLAIINECFPNPDNVVHDEKSSLKDLSEESQDIILENARVMFQSIEVRLKSIVDDESKACVKGDVLNEIINGETIAVGKLTINRSYNEIKHLYVDRRVKKTGAKFDKVVKTLNNIPDDVVLVTAEPGMGKSTLLTHLSLKTKERKPEDWIVRINLLEYSKEFSKWKEEETAIDTLETLNFMCHVVLREKLGSEENNVEIALEEENGIVYLKHWTGDQWTEFELNIFLHLYNKDMMIFLFDGFDEICPHYANEVIKCINNVSNYPRKHRKWITSRSYNEVKTILQREFGSSYEIDFFSNEEMERYLETFWDFHLRLEDLNSAQLENVNSFIQYMLDSENQGLHNFAMPLHQVYINAAYYLINEIKYKNIPLWIYSKIFDDSKFIQAKDDMVILTYHEDNSHGNPLHLYLAAVYFEHNIKSVNKNANEWNLEVNAFTFYERFMEKKMKTIRFQEKNEMNIYNPDIMMTYDKELADFILKHKKLAAYAIFNLQSDILFSLEDLVEIKETIKFIEKGGEKTGLIYRVANDIPIFIHMTFTEYFAVEYVCDCLKNENDSEKLTSWMNFIINVMFSMDSLMYIRNIFDYRITIDAKLMRILENNKEVIFNLIMEQGRVYSEIVANMRLSPYRNAVGYYWAIADALQQELHNFKLFFLTVLEDYLNKSNLNDFLDIVKGSGLLSKCKSNVMIMFVIDTVRRIDESKLTAVLQENFSFLSDSAISRCIELSSLEIVELLHAREEYSESFDSQPTASTSNSDWHISLYGISKRRNPPSLSSGSPTFNLSRHQSTHSLTSGSPTSNLSRHQSTHNLSSGSPTFNLSRHQSTHSLPSGSPTSNMSRHQSTHSLPSGSPTSKMSRHQSTHSLPSGSPTSNMSRHQSTHSLPSGSPTSNMSRHQSTHSLPSGSPTSNMSRHQSTHSLPSGSPTSNMSRHQSTHSLSSGSPTSNMSRHQSTHSVPS